MTVKVEIKKQRKHTHQFTELDFLLEKRHNVKIELIAGKFGGSFKTEFLLWIDNEIRYQKNLYTFLIQRMKFTTKIEKTECSIKYTWMSGIWFGHIYLDGKSVV